MIIFAFIKRLLEDTSFSGLRQYDLARECFTELVAPILDNKEAFFKLSAKHLVMLYEIIELLYGKQPNSELFLKYEDMVKQLNKDKLNYLLIESTKDFEKYKSSMTFFNLYKWRLDELKESLKKEPTFSWSMPIAKMIQHPRVENFLRSDDQTLEYTGFVGIADARTFVNKFQGFNKEYAYSVSMTPSGIGKKAHVFITKTRDLYNSLTRCSNAQSEYDYLIEKFKMFLVKK